MRAHPLVAIVVASAGCKVDVLPERNCRACSPAGDVCYEGETCSAFFGDTPCERTNPVADGTGCGGGFVCRAGTCAFCNDKADGTVCGDDDVCLAHACVSACVTRADGAPCKSGWVCLSGQCEFCNDQPDGAACGDYSACLAHRCASVCAQPGSDGVACAPTGACSGIDCVPFCFVHADGTACGEGMFCHEKNCEPFCTSQPDGTSCGMDQVCRFGACVPSAWLRYDVAFTWKFENAAGQEAGDGTAHDSGCATAGVKRITVDIDGAIAWSGGCEDAVGAPAGRVPSPGGEHAYLLRGEGVDGNAALLASGTVVVETGSAVQATLRPVAGPWPLVVNYELDGAVPTDCSAHGLAYRLRDAGGNVVASSSGAGQTTVAPGVIDRCLVAYSWMTTGFLQAVPWGSYTFDYIATLDVAADGSVSPDHQACSVSVAHTGFPPAVSLSATTSPCF